MVLYFTKYISNDLKENVGRSVYVMMKKITEMFIDERMRIFNKYYKIGLSFGNHIPILFTKKGKKTFHVEFTILKNNRDTLNQ